MPRKAMQLQKKLEKSYALPNLEESESESQAVCKKCHSSSSSFRYELFSADRLVKGSCCAGCFLDLLRGLRCGEH